MNWREFFLLGMLALMCLLSAIGISNVQGRLEVLEARVHAIDGR